MYGMDQQSGVSDTTLVQRCLSGDATAWQQLVERYARLVHGIAVRHGLSAPEAEDIGQDVFLALAQTLHAIEVAQRLPGWLATTARRLCWRAVQKRRREQPHDQADLVDSETLRPLQPLFNNMPSIDDLLAGWNRQEQLSLGLQRLSERCRTLLTLLFLEADEPSYDAISLQLGIPKGSIGPTRTRCLQQLRVVLEGLI